MVVTDCINRLSSITPLLHLMDLPFGASVGIESVVSGAEKNIDEALLTKIGIQDSNHKTLFGQFK